MLIKKFKNGNFNVKYEADYDYNDNLIEQLCNSAELDFCTSAEWWSLGNHGMAMTLFNYKTGLSYNVTKRDIERFKHYKTIKLYGYKEDENNDYQI